MRLRVFWLCVAAILRGIQTVRENDAESLAEREKQIK